jgi:hypothetical protein
VLGDDVKIASSPAITMLDEIAMAINERDFRRQPGECSFYPQHEPEMKALMSLIQQRVEQDNPSLEIIIGFAALLVIDGMVAQNLCDLRLTAQSLPPFGRERAP